MHSMKRLWIAFSLVMVLSFLVLGWIGARIYQEMPPIPVTVVTTDGKVMIDKGEVQAGQNVWQSLGGMEVGSVWGHGSYVAPDWTADWLHREAVFILDRWANSEFGTEYGGLDGEKQAQFTTTHFSRQPQTSGAERVAPSEFLVLSSTCGPSSRRRRSDSGTFTRRQRPPPKRLSKSFFEEMLSEVEGSNRREQQY